MQEREDKGERGGNGDSEVFFLGDTIWGVSPTRHPFAFYTNYRGHAFENIVVMLLAQERENERGGKGNGDVILSWGYHCGGIP